MCSDTDSVCSDDTFVTGLTTQEDVSTPTPTVSDIPITQTEEEHFLCSQIAVAQERNCRTLNTRLSVSAMPNYIPTCAEPTCKRSSYTAPEGKRLTLKRLQKYLSSDRGKDDIRLIYRYGVYYCDEHYHKYSSVPPDPLPLDQWTDNTEYLSKWGFRKNEGVKGIVPVRPGLEWPIQFEDIVLKSVADAIDCAARAADHKRHRKDKESTLTNPSEADRSISSRPKHRLNVDPKAIVTSFDQYVQIMQREGVDVPPSAALTPRAVWGYVKGRQGQAGSSETSSMDGREGITRDA